MTVTVPTLVLVLPPLVVVWFAWIWFVLWADRRWISPWLERLVVRKHARRYGMTEDEFRADLAAARAALPVPDAQEGQT